MPGTVLSARNGKSVTRSPSQNSQPRERDPGSVMTRKYTLEGLDLRALPQTLGVGKGFQRKRYLRPEESRGVIQERGEVAMGGRHE